MTYRLFATITIILVTLTGQAFLYGNDKPNIIIIMTDDMGFSDVGCYGSEIETPNLDLLGANGLRFTQFYNAGKCCPTRTSLMTGLYAHQAGMGGMTRDEGPKKPGYRGRIMPHAVTIAEVLKPAGYLTIQTGKWHLGDKKPWWPTARGFEKCFGSPAGGGFYFRPSEFDKPRFLVRGEEVIYDMKNDPPKDFYTTDAYTDEGLNFVREAVKVKKPFMWYLAYNAPHWPLKAKPEDIAKYKGKYKAGWDEIRRKRHEKLVNLGIINSSWKLSPRPKEIPAWDTLSDKQKDEQDMRMATYAAMVDCVDQNVGKVIKELKNLNVFDNTMIIFLCDNGGDHSGGKLGSNKWKGEVGTAESYAFYGTCWANVSNAPFKLYKSYMHEGGISTPFIVSWPKGIKQELNGNLIKQPTHLIDLMTTCVDISGAKYPTEYNGNKIVPMEGSSLNPLFKGDSIKRSEPLYFEFSSSKGVRHDNWKLVAKKGGTWELYNMEADRTELNDLAKQYPEKVSELAKTYNDWAERCHVKRSKK